MREVFRENEELWIQLYNSLVSDGLYQHTDCWDVNLSTALDDNGYGLTDEEYDDFSSLASEFRSNVEGWLLGDTTDKDCISEFLPN